MFIMHIDHRQQPSIPRQYRTLDALVTLAVAAPVIRQASTPAFPPIRAMNGAPGHADGAHCRGLRAARALREG